MLEAIVQRIDKLELAETQWQVERANLLLQINHLKKIVDSSALVPNLIPNSLMTCLATNCVPVGFSVAVHTIDPWWGLGESQQTIQLSAVHPFSQGFEGPYTPQMEPTHLEPSQHCDATLENPVWFGRWNKGSRVIRGGLGDGWSGTTSGHILKIWGSRAVGTIPVLQLPFVVAPMKKFRLECWIKIRKGLGVMFAKEPGHFNNFSTSQEDPRPPKTCRKSDCWTSAEAWYLFDEVIEDSYTYYCGLFMACFGDDAGFGEFEIYLAMPYLTAVRQENMISLVPNWNDGKM